MAVSRFCRCGAELHPHSREKRCGACILALAGKAEWMRRVRMGRHKPVPQGHFIWRGKVRPRKASEA